MYAFDKHLAAITSGTVTKPNVIGIRKLIKAADRRRRGLSLSVTSPFFHDGDDKALLKALESNPPKVAGDLHDSGLKLLQSRRYRKRLLVVADIISTITEFRLVGFDWAGQIETQTPIYRAVSPLGSFTFLNVPWQNGGDGPQVIKVQRGPYIEITPGGFRYARLRVGVSLQTPDGSKEVYFQPGDDTTAILETIAALEEVDEAKRPQIAAMALGDYFDCAPVEVESAE